ncbi:MAG: hypothetical protein ABSG60_08345 [Terracidiphilus sp.]
MIGQLSVVNHSHFRNHPDRPLAIERRLLGRHFLDPFTIPVTAELPQPMTAKSNEQPYAVPPQPAKNGFSLISSEKLLQLYSTMLKCRMIEDRTCILFNNNDFAANYDSAAGREAVAVGVAIDLFPEDTIVPSHGDLIPFFINGLPLETLSGGFFHPIAP